MSCPNHYPTELCYLRCYFLNMILSREIFINKQPKEISVINRFNIFIKHFCKLTSQIRNNRYVEMLLGMCVGERG